MISAQSICRMITLSTTCPDGIASCIVRERGGAGAGASRSRRLVTLEQSTLQPTSIPCSRCKDRPNSGGDSVTVNSWLVIHFETLDELELEKRFAGRDSDEPGSACEENEEGERGMQERASERESQGG
eukprot:765030-Hanusia_phi.AAC.1